MIAKIATLTITLTGYDEFSKSFDKMRGSLSCFESLGAVAAGAALAMNEWAQVAARMAIAEEEKRAKRWVDNASDEQTTTAIGYETPEGPFDYGTTEPDPTPTRQTLPRQGPGNACPKKPKNYFKENLHRQDRRPVKAMRRIKL